jgi:hypothetical protein
VLIRAGRLERVGRYPSGIGYLDTEDGRVCQNRYVMWGRVACSVLRESEVYEDTQATKALDDYLTRRESIRSPQRSAASPARRPRK